VFALPADETQRLCPTQSEQHQVQNDQVIVVASNQFQLFVALGRNVASKSLRHQALNDTASNLLFILDE
jgi:hypothetical protein